MLLKFEIVPVGEKCGQDFVWFLTRALVSLHTRRVTLVSLLRVTDAVCSGMCRNVCPWREKGSRGPARGSFSLGQGWVGGAVPDIECCTNLPPSLNTESDPDMPSCSAMPSLRQSRVSGVILYTVESTASSKKKLLS